MHVMLPILLCWGTGLALVCAGWGTRAPLTSDPLLKMSLATGCGFGLFSIVFFLCLTLSLSSLILADAAVLGLLLASLLWIRLRRTSVTIAKARRDIPAAWVGVVLTGGFACSLMVCLYSAIARTKANPHGIGWHALA